MKNYTAKIALFSVIATVIAAPVLLRADDTSTNAPDTTAPATPMPAKHHRGAPFHGTLDSVDTNAMTLTVGSRTFQITSKTKIKKDGQPAVLADGIVGQPVSGFYRTNDDGEMKAVSVYFGAHAKKKKQNLDDSTSMSTNAPSSN